MKNPKHLAIFYGTLSAIAAGTGLSNILSSAVEKNAYLNAHLAASPELTDNILASINQASNTFREVDMSNGVTSLLFIIASGSTAALSIYHATRQPVEPIK